MICNLVNKEKETGSVEDIPRPGRPPIYDEREERMILREAAKKPFDSLRDLEFSRESNLKEASKDTLARIFKKHDVVS